MLGKCFLLALLIVAARAAEEDVLEWGDSDFQHEIERHENTLVMFYAPWCGHCKRLKPEYAKAAELLRGSDPPITLAKVDCTEAGKDTCSKFSVSGYPTLKIFAKSDLVTEYNGPREAAGIAKHMKAQVGPASKELTSEKCLEDFLKGDEAGVVGYFKDPVSELAVAFHNVAKKLKEKYRFAHTSTPELLKKDGHKNNIVLYRPKILHNKFEEASVVLTGGDSMTEIGDFIQRNSRGLVGLRSKDNAGDFKTPLVVAYYAVDYIKNPKGTNYWRNRILKVAKNFPKLNFAVSNKDEFQPELNEFGIDFVKGDKPVVGARDDKNQKFVMTEEFSVENFEKFLKDLESGSLDVYLKSEPIPEDNSGSVKVAVAKNFDDLVTNNDKDILIEFYAPWCGHCKKLAPVFDELGDKMANEDVEIIKFDATANDVPPQFEVRGFPSLFWVSKDDKKNPVKYEGGRELTDFVTYIAKHSTDKLKGYDRSGNTVKTGSDEL